MAVLVAWGIWLAWVWSPGPLSRVLDHASHSIIAWGLSFLTAFAFARRFGPLVRSPRGRTTVSVLLTIALTATLYLAWAHHRSAYMFPSVAQFDYSFPYPDRGINALERWFDARRPAPPGTLKMHGEYIRVAAILGALAFVCAGVTGCLVGLLSNRPDDTQPERR
jgi:hypothetical protein